MCFLLKGCSVHRHLPHVTANSGKKHQIIFPIEKYSKNSEFDENYKIQESDFSEKKLITSECKVAEPKVRFLTLLFDSNLDCDSQNRKFSITVSEKPKKKKQTVIENFQFSESNIPSTKVPNLGIPENFEHLEIFVSDQECQIQESDFSENKISDSKCRKNSAFDEKLNIYKIQESDLSENEIFDLKGIENFDQENKISLTKQCDILKTGEQGYETDSTISSQYTAISGFGPGFENEIKVCFFVPNL